MHKKEISTLNKSKWIFERNDVQKVVLRCCVDTSENAIFSYRLGPTNCLGTLFIIEWWCHRAFSVVGFLRYVDITSMLQTHELGTSHFEHTICLWFPMLQPCQVEHLRLVLRLCESLFNMSLLDLFWFNSAR